MLDLNDDKLDQLKEVVGRLIKSVEDFPKEESGGACNIVICKQVLGYLSNINHPVLDINSSGLSSKTLTELWHNNRIKKSTLEFAQLLLYFSKPDTYQYYREQYKNDSVLRDLLQQLSSKINPPPPPPPPPPPHYPSNGGEAKADKEPQKKEIWKNLKVIWKKIIDWIKTICNIILIIACVFLVLFLIYKTTVKTIQGVKNWRERFQCHTEEILQDSIFSTTDYNEQLKILSTAYSQTKRRKCQDEIAVIYRQVDSTKRIYEEELEQRRIEEQQRKSVIEAKRKQNQKDVQKIYHTLKTVFPIETEREQAKKGYLSDDAVDKIFSLIREAEKKDPTNKDIKKYKSEFEQILREYGTSY